jgi:hypothetical protein
MAVERIVEEIIRKAIERGDFRNLLSKGKPVNLSIYFQAPEDARVAQALLKDAGIAPREMELLREIWDLRQSEATCADAETKAAIRKQIAKLQLELDLRTERHRRRPRGG